MLFIYCQTKKSQIQKCADDGDPFLMHRKIQKRKTRKLTMVGQCDGMEFFSPLSCKSSKMRFNYFYYFNEALKNGWFTEHLQIYHIRTELEVFFDIPSQK